MMLRFLICYLFVSPFALLAFWLIWRNKPGFSLKGAIHFLGVLGILAVVLGPLVIAVGRAVGAPYPVVVVVGSTFITGVLVCVIYLALRWWRAAVSAVFERMKPQVSGKPLDAPALDGVRSFEALGFGLVGVLEHGDGTTAVLLDPTGQMVASLVKHPDPNAPPPGLILDIASRSSEAAITLTTVASSNLIPVVRHDEWMQTLPGALPEELLVVHRDGIELLEERSVAFDRFDSERALRFCQQEFDRYVEAFRQARLGWLMKEQRRLHEKAHAAVGPLREREATLEVLKASLG
jgi:hypothetical protein